jgi:hypothetical protein
MRWFPLVPDEVTSSEGVWWLPRDCLSHDRSWPVKKGRHRRFEEARALKRSQDIDIEGLFESLQSERPAGSDEDHPEWAEYAADEDDET